MTAQHGKWNYPTTVHFGAGIVSSLPELCRGRGIGRPLVVTDEGLAETEMVHELVRHLSGSGLRPGLFSDVQGNPVGKNVDDGTAVLKEGEHDGVVAIGGGSALDVGKAIALMAGQDRPLWDFEDVGDNWLRVNEAGVLDTIAIATTAGTGSEVGRSSVITNEAETRKIIIFHPKMMPAVALCDPELTISLPKHLTAATGMDAMSHSLEAYCATGFHPMADGIATEGIRLVRKSLKTATFEPDNLEARADMLAASLMGATAFQKGLGGMHALSHPIGTHLHKHHGLINAVMMPYVLAYNKGVIEERIERLAAAIGLPDVSFTGFLRWVLDLRKELGIVHTAAELDMTEDHIDLFSSMAEQDPAGFGNPIKLTKARYQELYRAALSGTLPAAAQP